MLPTVNTEQAMGASPPVREAVEAALGGEGAASIIRRNELRFVWAFWAFIAALTFVNALMNDAMSGPTPRLPAMAPFVTAVVNCLLWGALTPIMFRLTSRFSLDRPNWMLSLALLLAAGLLISIGVAELMRYLRYQQAMYYLRIGALDRTSQNFDPSVVAHQFWFMKEFVIYLVVLSGGYAHDYFVRYRVRHQQAQLLEAQAAHFRAELADARLSALRSQLNPHFLFNTLNTVSSLVEKDPRGARRMIAHLSDLLRDTLDITAQEISLESELRTMRRYVDIMRTRFGGRLDVSEEIAADAGQALVPTLLLQPLVENAIKHGIEKWGGRESIQVRALRSGESLLISVINSGASASPALAGAEGGGVGLQNTRDRLRQCYGERQALSLKGRPGGGAVVEVSLPFHTQVRLANPLP